MRGILGKTGIRGKLASLVVVALLAGCAAPGIAQLPRAPSGAKVELRPLPESVYVGLRDIAIAKMIGQYCLTIRTKDREVMAAEQSVIDELKRRNYNQAEARLAVREIDKARVQKDVFDYFEDNGILIDSGRSYCPAGEREIARKSGIGVLLATFGK